MLDALILFLTQNPLIRGAILGFLIAAPVGPIGLMVIRRTLARGPLIGISTGFGAGTADTFFGAVAAFGVTVMITFLTEHGALLKLLGAVFLFYAAYAAWHARVPNPSETNETTPSTGGLIKAFTTGFGLTFTNPVSLIAVLAVITTLGGQMDKWEASVFVAGVFIGATAWWCCLVGLISLIRHKFTTALIVRINHVTAVVLAVLGVYALCVGLIGVLDLSVTAMLQKLPFFDRVIHP